VRRGEIYLADLSFLDERAGQEIQDPRPAIIVSNDTFNGRASWKTVVVVPVSTSPAQAQRQFSIVLPKGTGGLSSDSVALCHQVTTISRSRLLKHIGALTSAEMKPIDQDLVALLYL
jgi:mRNA interferase MazF